MKEAARRRTYHLLTATASIPIHGSHNYSSSQPDGMVTVLTPCVSMASAVPVVASGPSDEIVIASRNRRTRMRGIVCRYLRLHGSFTCSLTGSSSCTPASQSSEDRTTSYVKKVIADAGATLHAFTK